jgi:hypothetical protein
MCSVQAIKFFLARVLLGRLLLRVRAR